MKLKLLSNKLLQMPKEHISLSRASQRLAYIMQPWASYCLYQNKPTCFTHGLFVNLTSMGLNLERKFTLSIIYNGNDEKRLT